MHQTPKLRGSSFSISLRYYIGTPSLTFSISRILADNSMQQAMNAKYWLMTDLWVAILYFAAIRIRRKY